MHTYTHTHTHEHTHADIYTHAHKHTHAHTHAHTHTHTQTHIQTYTLAHTQAHTPGVNAQGPAKASLGAGGGCTLSSGGAIGVSIFLIVGELIAPMLFKLLNNQNKPLSLQT
jgi:ABC-type nickel/cobalt efflux system permease component RcnA